MKNFNLSQRRLFLKGFTLIELLVVVAVIAMLAGLSFPYLGIARKKGNDAGVKSNMQTVRALSEIFYLDNASSYLPSGGTIFNVASCPPYDVAGTNMFSKNKNIADALVEVIRRSNGSHSCGHSTDFWAVAIGLNLDTATSWCIDNSGIAKISSFVPSSAINPLTFQCK